MTTYLFQVTLDRAEISVGDRLSGRLVITAPDDWKMPKVKGIRVGTRCEIGGFAEKQTIRGLGDWWRPAPLLEREYDFHFPFLSPAPVSYSGTLLTVRWELVAEFEIPWHYDPAQTLPITVLPRRR